jgi:hypothetical protein
MLRTGSIVTLAILRPSAYDLAARREISVRFAILSKRSNNDLVINLVEVVKESRSFGGGIAQYVT